jgi:LAO/AO transport system kinase
MGVRWAGSGQKVAVLAVDPSSSLHRGSILGDKTRMDQLSKHPNAFIRPVASGGQLGGVAASTRAAIQLLEHAGYTRIVLETVGVGQNETDAVHYVDGLLLVALPNSGDDVQGIKRGIMERADLIAVNKCDGSFAEAGQRAALQLRESMKWFRRDDGWNVPVVQVSATELRGLGELDEALDRYERWVRGTGSFDARRSDQRAHEWAQTWPQFAVEWALKHPDAAGAYAKAHEAFSQGQSALGALRSAFNV